jgi:hypothetical protein
VVRGAAFPLILLPLIAVPSAGQGSDTAVTVHGFLEPADSSGWRLVLPQPLAVAGRRLNLVVAHGDVGRFARLQDRFVEVRGRVLTAGDTGLEVTQLREVEPAGAGRSTVHPSFSQNAVVTLAAIPNDFTWRLPDGQPSGVQPLLMYTILNHGQTQLDFIFRSNDVLCVDVQETSGGETWQTTVPAPTRSQERIVIRLGGVYRHFIPITPEAAPRPSRYVARVALCGVADYAVETQFVVRAP